MYYKNDFNEGLEFLYYFFDNDWYKYFNKGWSFRVVSVKMGFLKYRL